MKDKLRRIIWKIRNLRDGFHELNRRAAVEQEMWNCVNGKSPMPDSAKLREWALRLGVPKEFKRS